MNFIFLFFAISLFSACNPLVSNPTTDASFFGSPAVTPIPVLSITGASIDISGFNLTVQILSSSALSPESGVSGFSVLDNGSTETISSVTRTGSTEYTLVLETPVFAADSVTLSYSAGNITNSSSAIVANTNNFSVSNQSPFDADLKLYYNAIVANGGTISQGSLVAVQAFVTGLKADSLWTKLTEIYPFAGDQLSAALTKLKVKLGNSSTLTNNGFVGADYHESGAAGGIQGNFMKYLDTNISVPSLTRNNISMGAYVNVDSSNIHAYSGIIGSSYPATGDADRFYLAGNGYASPTNQVGLGAAYDYVNFPSALGLQVLSYDGSALNYYSGLNSLVNSGNTFYQTSASLIWQQPGNVQIFRCTVNGFDGRMSFAFVGESLTPTDIVNLVNLVQTLQNTLGR